LRAPKKQQKEATIEEKRENTIDDLVMKNIPRALTRLNASMSMNQ
jgi:CRISPR/Cas system CSM-associated protein Csm3 (group 7 of RAMP superfamily)